MVEQTDTRSRLRPTASGSQAPPVQTSQLQLSDWLWMHMSIQSDSVHEADWLFAELANYVGHLDDGLQAA